MRLSPVPVWRAHLDALTKHPTDRPDWVTRGVLFGVPAVVGVVAYLFDAQLRQPGALLAGAALLAGTLFASFGQLASFRGRLADSLDTSQVAFDALDETVAHVLMAVYVAITAAAVLGAATSLSAGPVRGVFAALALALGVWLLLLVLLITPRLYQAYTYAYVVRDPLNGYIRATYRDDPELTRHD